MKTELSPYQKSLIFEASHNLLSILAGGAECFDDNVNLNLKSLKKRVKEFDEDFNSPENELGEEICDFSAEFHTSLRNYLPKYL